MRSLLFAVLALLLLAAPACSKPRLIDAPYVMRTEEARAIYESAPESVKTPDIPILYVTNRAVDRETSTGPRYGYKRAQEMSYGIARIGLSPEPTWETLVDDSVHGPRENRYEIRVASVEPVGVVQPLMKHMAIENGRITVAKDAINPIMAERNEFDKLFDLWFGPGNSGDACIYVHGFNNTFDDAALRVAEAWHASGRHGLPICFTWPAGSGGLKGYAYDRESGEFSVVPLKSLIWMLVASPRVNKLHIIAHSRGTDVATTALREIQFEIRGLFHRSFYAPRAGREMVTSVLPDQEVYKVLKLETLILAAPDMDIDVFGQRFLNEGLIHVADRVVIYTSENDKALGLSNWLFRGRSRLGDMKLSAMDPKMIEILSQVDKLEIINCAIQSHDSHGYIFRDPAALSDLILLMRDDLDPGPDGPRPLNRANACVWQLDNDYLRPASP